MCRAWRKNMTAMDEPDSFTVPVGMRSPSMAEPMAARWTGKRRLPTCWSICWIPVYIQARRSHISLVMREKPSAMGKMILVTPISKWI